jgi:hypothetical protein
MEDNRGNILRGAGFFSFADLRIRRTEFSLGNC